MFKFKVLVIASIAALSFSAVQAAEVIYKWKDSSGNIKYTQSKPPSGIAYTVIRNRSTKSSTPASTASQKTETPVSEEDRIIAAQNVEKNRVDALNAERAAKNCTISKNNLEALERTTRIQVEENGERRILSDEERAKKMDEAKDNIQKFCK